VNIQIEIFRHGHWEQSKSNEKAEVYVFAHRNIVETACAIR